MAKELEFPSEDALSFIRDVKVTLLADKERFQQFQQILTNFNEGTITPQQVESYVNILLSDHPHLLQQFHQFMPIYLNPNQENTIQEIDKETQLTVFEESAVVEKQDSRKDDLEASIVYIKRVLKGLEDQPDSLSKFFDLLEQYKGGRDQERLKHGLFPLFKSCPEFQIMFTQFTVKEPSPLHEKAEVIVSRDLSEERMNKYEDEMYGNDMCISRINLAIENTLKFLMARQKGRGTVRVTNYLTGDNLKAILKYCNVNLQDNRHVEEAAYSVVGKLKVQLEVKKEKRVNIRRNLVSEIQKLRNKKRRRMIMN